MSDNEQMCKDFEKLIKKRLRDWIKQSYELYAMGELKGSAATAAILGALLQAAATGCLANDLSEESILDLIKLSFRQAEAATRRYKESQR